MARRSVVAVLLVVVLSGLLVLPVKTHACGPFFARAVTVYKVHPDFPLARFAEGQIGILEPTYARSYLFAAYRYLSGQPLDAGQQKAVVSLWNDRLNYSEAPDTNNASNPNDPAQWPAAWKDVRAKFSGLPAAQGPDDVFRAVGGTGSYDSYPNCLRNSFETAAATLSARIKQFGADSAEVRDWVQAQDTVYSNCTTGAAAPGLAKSGSPALVQADRAYQIAAANFYAGKFDDAGKMFGDIAADTASPWSKLAPYLVARCLVRKACLTAGASKWDLAILGQAESQLIKVLGDSRLQSVHPAAGRLLNFVRFRLHPNERIRELADAVTKKQAAPGFGQDLCDYTLLMDNLEKDMSSAGSAARKDDVTDWIAAFQDASPTSVDYCFKRWTESHSNAWLVAALSKANASFAGVPDLIAATKRVKKGTPAFADASYHAARLMIQAAKKQEARGLIDSVLTSDTSTLPRSAINQFLSERMYLATNLAEFLKYAQRMPSAISLDYDGQELPEDPTANNEIKPLVEKPGFDSDSVRIINERLPLSVLKEAVASKALPGPMEQALAIATWTRAVMLDDEQVARQTGTLLKAEVPELSELMTSYLTAVSSEDKKYAGIFLMLRNPGTRPYISTGVGRITPIQKMDEYRDNWWCVYSAGRWGEIPNWYLVSGSESPSEQKKAPEMKSPDFLTSAERTAMAAEWKKLSAIPTAPNYLCAQVVEWADKKANDPRLPEALALAVKATRYGCTDKETRRYSKAAFDLLHKRFPETSWAKNTKYWYGS